MCTSVPQIDAFNTRMSTSSPPRLGTGTFSSHRPGSALAFTTAFIVFNTSGNYPKFSQIHTDSSARFKINLQRICVPGAMLQLGSPIPATTGQLACTRADDVRKGLARLLRSAGYKAKWLKKRPSLFRRDMRPTSHIPLAKGECNLRRFASPKYRCYLPARTNLCLATKTLLVLFSLTVGNQWGI